MRTSIALPLPTALSCRAAGYAAPLAALAVNVVLPLSALAAESSGRTLEEVIVTAQRREQSLQDVPVAVSVVSAETIRDLSLQNLDQLSNYVPGFNVREGGEQTSISLRGFATGLNFGFDQSVGLFIDGIYAGRERQFRSTFLDIGSVEVLKGPQATLFGKNTTAGAVIINTGRPTHEFHADVAADFSSEIDRQVYTAVVNSLSLLTQKTAALGRVKRKVVPRPVALSTVTLPA